MRTFESEPMQSRDAAVADARDRQEPVAEVRLGRRAHADRARRRRAAGRARARPRASRARRSCAGRGSPRGRAARSAAGRARPGTPRSRAAARRRARAAAARARRRSAPSSRSASAGHARTEWGATPTAMPVVAQRLELRRGTSATESCRKRGDAAAEVAGVEADERDAGLGGGLGGGARLVEPEVVELADRRVAVRAQLAVDLDVLAPDLGDGHRLGERDHLVAPGPEVAAAGAAAERALERVAVGVHEARDRERRHRRILSA